MTREEAIKGLTSLVEVRRKYFDMQTMKDEIECLDMAIKALELVNDFESARIVTGGRLNGRTYAYKCGLADGQRLARGEKIFNVLPLKQQPCEDAISRQAVVDWLTERTEKYDEKGHFISKELVKAEVENWLAELPSVTPVNVYVKGYKDAMEMHEKLKVEHKGKWMVEHNCEYVRCSICNKRVPFCKRSNFCPNCGAEMGV